MYNLGQLAQIIKAELIGDPQAVVQRVAPFDSARSGDVTFAMDDAYRARLGDSRATVVIISPPVLSSNHNLLVAANPKLAFARAIHALHGESYNSKGVSDDLVLGEGAVMGRNPSIHPRVTIGHHSVIGDRVTLHPGVVIGDRCRIGDDTMVYPNVTIYDDCEVGNRVIIHAGTVIGSEGFGFVSDEEGHQVKMLQLGRVRIEDDCEIGANCAIDRGGFGDTVIKRGVKLDNLIQVAHNTEIGEDTVIAALTGISGGTLIGRRCVIAGQVGIAHHISIGDGAIITGKTVVTKNVRAGAMMGGTMPARDYNAWRRSQVLYSRLPDIVNRLKQLEKAIQKLMVKD